MITSLHLKNWRTHKDTLLEFGKGTNVIVGVMGSGKSSIVNGISYALFGTFPAAKNKSVALKEIIQNKPNPCDSAEITLTFTSEDGASAYRVERRLTLDGESEAKLYDNNKLIAGPKQKEVTERIESILGLNYELFSRAVYAEQNEMDFFLKLGPSERKKKFDELLELATYEEARKNAVAVQNEIIKENKHRAEFIAQQRETIKSHEEEKLLAAIAAEEKNTQALILKLAETQKAITFFEKELHAHTAKEKQQQTLATTLIQATSRAQALQEDIERSERISIDEVKKMRERRTADLAMAREGKTLAEKAHKESDAALKKLSEDVRVLTYRKQVLQKEETAFTSLKGDCPTCKQPLDATHAAHFISKTQTELASIAQSIVDHEKNIREYRLTLDALDKELKAHTTKSDEAQRELYKLDTLEKQALAVVEKKKELAKVLELIPTIEKDIKEVGFDKAALEKSRNAYFEHTSSVRVIENQIRASNELCASHLAMLDKIKHIKKSIEDNEALATRANTAAQKLGVFSNCLIATQVELREALLETINAAMGNIWGSIYPYTDFTDARLCVVPTGYDLQVRTRSGEWIRVEGILSGGERSAAAICIRIAFALVLTKKLSLLILDEPTHNLDSHAVEKLATMLRENLPTLVSQIFVITHEEQLESAASSNLYVLSRNKNDDQATSVSVTQAA